MSIVSIKKLKNIYDANEISIAIRSVINDIGGIDSIVKTNDTVILKPNLFITRNWKTGTTTNPQIVEEMIKIVLDAGGTPIITESAGIGRDTQYLFNVLGYSDLAKKYKIKLIDINKSEYIAVSIPKGVIFKELNIPKIVQEADVIIDLPKMKTHMSTTVTLGMKNLKGFLPGDEKRKPHKFGLHQGIVDLNKIIKPDLIVVDGLVAMEGNGPSYGDPIELGVIVAGKNVVAVDTVCCKIMNIDPLSVEHIQLAYEQGMKPSKIEQVGDSVSRDFKIPIEESESFIERIINYINNVLGRKVVIISKERCTGCGQCLKICEENAINVEKKIIDKDKCTKCEICIELCPYKAVVYSYKYFYLLNF